jgi:ketosteroid isomerase-like protein
MSNSLAVPTTEERDALFKTFGRAWFRRDIDLLYQVVTPDFEWRNTDKQGRATLITGREAIASALTGRADGGTKLTFSDVVYHHAPGVTFMTFRVVESDKETGAVVREDIGIERYTFKDGLIALKDVYRKPAQ